MDNTSTIQLCEYCGNYHPGQVCWRIEQIEYHLNGNVKFLKLHQPQFVNFSEAMNYKTNLAKPEAVLPLLAAVGIDAASEAEAADFGRRLARELLKSSSSTAYFFVQQAYDDVEWEEVKERLDRIAGRAAKNDN